MTRQEIQERNRQIALMLGGYKCSEISEQYELPKFMTFPPKGKSNLCHTAKVCLLENMQFHSDWSWLMEAVEFIERLSVHHMVETNRSSCVIYNGKSIITANYFKADKTKTEAVFIAVSDFAKLYNNKEL